MDGDRLFSTIPFPPIHTSITRDPLPAYRTDLVYCAVLPFLAFSYFPPLEAAAPLIDKWGYTERRECSPRIAPTFAPLERAIWREKTSGREETETGGKGGVRMEERKEIGVRGRTDRFLSFLRIRTCHAPQPLFNGVAASG